METKKAPPTTPLQDSEEKSASPSLDNFLILVVDDVVDNLAILSLDLQQQGYRVVTASNGEEAVKVASLTYPDIILMDLAMPQIDGLEATRRIRENESLRAVPVIAITAFDTGGFQRAAHDSGFDGYLTKPINFDRLHDLIKHALRLK